MRTWSRRGWSFIMLRCFVLLAFFGQAVTGQRLTEVLAKAAYLPTKFSDHELGISCISHQNETIRNRTAELKCCQLYHETFSTYWYLGGMYLTEFMETMKIWKCPQHDYECANRSFNFTDFTSKVYQRSCNYSTFQQECYKVNKVLNSFAPINTTNNSKTKTTNENNVHQLSTACQQVLAYDQGQKFGGFHEVVTYMLPFCDVAWCGKESKNGTSASLSIWECIKDRCQVSIITCIVVCGVLGLGTTVVNICVLAVFYSNKTLLNSQGFYKLSLAISDLIVGVVVLPSCGYFLHTIATHQFEMKRLEINETTYFLPSGHFGDIKFGAFGQFAGFATSLSLCVSINSLMLAAIDRLDLVRAPLKYNAEVARQKSWKFVLFLWMLAIVFSLLPLFVNTLRFSMISSVLIASSGPHALYLYLITLLIPFLATWGVTVATCCYTFSHAIDRNANEFSMEIKLTKTLIIMVIVFTLNLLPTILAVIGSIFLRGIYYFQPGNLDRPLAAAYVSYEFIAILLLVSNSSWNFFVYNARNESFRTSSRSLVMTVFDVRGMVSKVRNTTTTATTSVVT